jgi:hypothetical protein
LSVTNLKRRIFPLVLGLIKTFTFKLSPADSGGKFLKGGIMKFLLSMLFVSGLSYAQVNQVEIKNFNFSYKAPLGEGLAESFSYQQQKMNQQKVFVEKFAEAFKIKLEGQENQELEFKGAPQFVQDADIINLNGFNVGLMDQVSLSLIQGEFVSPSEKLNLKNVNLSCDRIDRTAQILDEVLNGCLQRMSLKVSGFASQPEKGLDIV